MTCFQALEAYASRYTDTRPKKKVEAGGKNLFVLMRWRVCAQKRLSLSNAKPDSGKLSAGRVNVMESFNTNRLCLLAG